MIKLSDYQTQEAFPAEMRTAERVALAYAFDRQKKKYIGMMSRVYIWADLEMVDDGKLDFLAVESRALFYNAGFAPEVKRRLIQNAVYWYMKLGTRQAMEEMVDTVFGDGKVREWHEYGDSPYYFRVSTSAIFTPEMESLFLSMAGQIKNARSRLRMLEIQRNVRQEVFAGAALSHVCRPPAVAGGYAVSREADAAMRAGMAGAQAHHPGAVYDGPGQQRKE